MEAEWRVYRYKNAFPCAPLPLQPFVFTASRPLLSDLLLHIVAASLRTQELSELSLVYQQSHGERLGLVMAAPKACRNVIRR